LEQRVRQGVFREDLYHRLNVIRLRLPPLRERVEDIPALVDYFLRRSAAEIGMEPKRLRADALALLQRASWPGNIRQLENVCRRLTIMAPSPEITAEDLPDEILGEGAPDRSAETDFVWVSALRAWAERQLRSGSTTSLLDEALPRFEATMIQVALRSAGGHRQDAARLLGWGRNTLTRKIQLLGLEDKL
jgi:two-component system nitrogen regulation response regulator GlnG